MKLRVGACALMLVLAGCSGEGSESGVAGMRGVAASKPVGSLSTLPLARAIGASIANAPDRGALLAYPNKAVPTKQEGAYTWFPTAISEAHAFKGIATGEMTVPSPDGSQVKLRYERHVEEIDGNWTWIGRVVGGDQMQEAIITFGEKAVFGSIPQANGKPALSLQTRNGTVFAVQTDPSKVVSATKGHEDVMIPEAATLRSSMAAAVSQSAQVSQGATAVAQAAPPSAANTIDVAVGYTPEFATANGGASGAATRLVFLVQVGNQAFANSDINGYLRIVNALQVSYTNTNTNQTALQELTGSTGSSPVTVPASLAPLRAARDQYGADIAVLVRKFNTPENEGCGIAWLNGANQTAITAADAAWGYAVISDGFDTGTDGKTYYCADETLVHEAAHLMGSAHDRANSTTTGGALQYGRYAYSFGYKTAAAAGNFYTVMAYGDTGQIAHRIFSTPLKSTCGASSNLPCGVANSEDNARSLNQTIPVVATFRATVVGFDKVRADRNGDGRSDIHWFNQSSGTLNAWLMNGNMVTGSTIDSASSTCTPRAFGDFNADSLSDVVLTCSGDSRVHVWLSTPSGYSRQVAGAFVAGWEIVGTADINGDGYDDIIWRQSSGGVTNVNVWHMRDSTVLSSFNRAVQGSCSVSGMGDINGDAKDDVALSCTDSSVYVLFGVTNGFAQYKVGTANAGWNLVGTIDANNDGKYDLVWHQPSTGLINTWVMNGTLVTSSFLHLIPVDCTPKSFGDYNGDGFGDIGLMCSSNQSAQILFSTGGNYNRFTAGGYASGWTMVR
ncbi:M12 family metallo-peptidase [Pseudoxanthomonas sp. LjRoot143]|uniref:reprolysin-like metallopeptidase n=1 Tax=Pseudoxanthomonas sp. LjRoot143 TaxID=3342266 RepID=UPI003ECD80E8